MCLNSHPTDPLLGLLIKTDRLWLTASTETSWDTSGKPIALHQRVQHLGAEQDNSYLDCSDPSNSVYDPKLGCLARALSV